MPANSGSALLRHQKVVYDMYRLTAEDGFPAARLRALLLGHGAGADRLVTVLETAPQLWDVSAMAQPALVEACALYVDACLDAGLVEAQVAAMRNLGDVLGELLGRGETDGLAADGLARLWAALASRPMHPALSDAFIRASGSIMAAMARCEAASAAAVHRWGRMMADAGLDDKVRAYTAARLDPERG